MSCLLRPQVDDDLVVHRRLGAKNKGSASDSDQDDSEDEKNAKQVNTHQKELQSLSIVCVAFILTAFANTMSCTNPGYTQVLLPTIQEYEKFVRLGDSLLTRASKLAELSQQLEDVLNESQKGPESSEGKKVKKFLDL